MRSFTIVKPCKSQLAYDNVVAALYVKAEECANLRAIIDQKDGRIARLEHDLVMMNRLRAERINKLKSIQGMLAE